jgi:hypothetical protein
MIPSINARNWFAANPTFTMTYRHLPRDLPILGLNVSQSKSRKNQAIGKQYRKRRGGRSTGDVTRNIVIRLYPNSIRAKMQIT